MTVITRSALVAWGHAPPPELHHIERDHRGERVVTWADVMQERREQQRRILLNKRSSPELRAYRLWVGYFDQRLMGGWHAFLDRGGEQVWICHRCPWLIPVVMNLFPLVLPGLPDRWNRWKQAFAVEHARGRHHGRPRGVAFVWWDGGKSPTAASVQRSPNLRPARLRARPVWP